MTCGLHSKLDAAVTAVKEALTVALDGDLAEKDLEVNFKTGHSINPLERGHIAYRTDDLEKFKNHLKSKGIKYSDWGETAVAGWKQIFFYDPDGNIIEVHEKEVS